MPRIARVVIPGCPHHIVQRGNRRLKSFFSDDDKELYCRLLKQQAAKYGIVFWAYCLMDNHIHLIAVPQRVWSLAKGIGEAHRRYTNVINIRENWKGFLWQGRFISFPLDEAWLYRAVRYIERNPVRAGIVQQAELYHWSSARAHVSGAEDVLLSDEGFPLTIKNWRAYLLESDEDTEVRALREHEHNGRPLGSSCFIEELERKTGRVLAIQKRGRKKGNRYCVPN